MDSEAVKRRELLLKVFNLQNQVWTLVLYAESTAGPTWAHVDGLVEKTQEIADMVRELERRTGASITCPTCGMTSHHPADVENRYCGNCRQFHADMALAGEHHQDNDQPHPEPGGQQGADVIRDGPPQPPGGG